MYSYLNEVRLLVWPFCGGALNSYTSGPGSGGGWVHGETGENGQHRESHNSSIKTGLVAVFICSLLYIPAVAHAAMTGWHGWSWSVCLRVMSK